MMKSTAVTICSAVLLPVAFLLACVYRPVATPPVTPAAPAAPVSTIAAYKFELGKMTVTPQEVQAGQPVQVSVIARNAGGSPNAYVGTLYVDGQEYARQAVSLNPGDSGTLAFQVSNLQAGNHNLTLGDSAGIVRVYAIEKFEIANTRSQTPPYANLDYSPAPPLPHISTDTFTPPVTPFFLQQINFRYPFPASFKILDATGKQLYAADIAYAQSAYVPDIEVNGDFGIQLETGQPTVDIRTEWFGDSSFALVIAYFWPEVSTIDGIQKRYGP
jgi:hypothetical protein